MHAANNGHAAVIKKLCGIRADLEHRNNNNFTALMVSVFCDRSAAAEELLAWGAQVSLLTSHAHAHAHQAPVPFMTCHGHFMQPVNHFVEHALTFSSQDSSTMQELPCVSTLHSASKLRDHMYAQSSLACKTLRVHLVPVGVLVGGLIQGFARAWAPAAGCVKA